MKLSTLKVVITAVSLGVLTFLAMSGFLYLTAMALRHPDIAGAITGVIAFVVVILVAKE